MAEARDVVDGVLDEWRAERPDLDVDVMGTFGRWARLAALMTRRIEGTLGAHGLTIADFDVLAALRRGGAPYERKPTEVARSLMLSPAGMTNRLDRLEAAGLVERRMAPEDRRSYLVRLSAAGLALVDDAVVDHLATEEALLAPLSATDRAHLDRILRRLLASG